MEYYLTTPLKKEEIEKLKSGDKVYISGIIYTARDTAHKRLVELLDNHQELPFDLKGQIIYYAGPAPAPPGKPIGSVGPTTSYRMDKYAPRLLDEGLAGMIGKGSRSQEVKDSIIKNKAIYFAAYGGAGALIAKCVIKAECLAFEELGPEAIYKLEVDKLPVFVVNDTYGNDLYIMKFQED